MSPNRVMFAVPAAGRRPSPQRRLRFAASALSDVGKVRDHNEDFAFAGETLLAVADGVGGRACGELASALAVESIAHLEDVRDLPDGEAGMRAAAESAHHRIAAAAQADASREGMATTLTALRLDGTALLVLNVGDSRAYRLHDERLRQLTRDDSLVQSLVDVGALSRDQARRHPARSMVLQALGTGEVEPRVETVEVAAGERYLLCSDGLSDYVDDADIERIVTEVHERAACCTALVGAALAVGAPDNVTCVVADVV